MSRGPLFRGSRDDFMLRCANCDGPMHIRNIVTTARGEFKVCSWACEKALKAKHETPETPVPVSLPVFVGCQNAVAFAAATCPQCGRKGQVGVSTPAIVLHKTMFCTDCTDAKDHDFEKQQEARG